MELEISATNSVAVSCRRSEFSKSPLFCTSGFRSDSRSHAQLIASVNQSCANDKHIVATLNTQQAADAAVHELRNAGFPTSGIRRYSARVAPQRLAPLDDDRHNLLSRRDLGLARGRRHQTTRDAYPTDETRYARRPAPATRS